MKKLNLAFFGTPAFSARLLEKILTDKDLPLEVKLVITQPDKPVGRKKILTPSPVKQIASQYQIPIYQYKNQQNLRTSQLSEQVSPDEALALRGRQKDEWSRRPQTDSVGMRVDLTSKFSLVDLLRKIDLVLLYAFGEIIPTELLKLPKYGFWNIHPSLLPKYRGASPMAYPLIMGDEKTGVTLMQMDEQMDHGPIIAQEEYEILPTDKRPDLEIKLTDLGYELFKKLISTNFNQFQPIQQDQQNATYTRRLSRDDGFIPLSTLKKALHNEPLTADELPKIIKDFSINQKIPHQNLASHFPHLTSSAKTIYNLFCGLYPWPGLWTLTPESKRLKITDMSLDMLHASGFKPQVLSEVEGLHINRVQIEGKKECLFTEFCKTNNLFKTLCTFVYAIILSGYLGIHYFIKSSY
ncbi:hypothetical protein A3C23_04740 [Candidatus Roizmanbacteria bacterium RIFCSPHIGHO2_02_FULL_37_13b]|uniref:Methionyl-tRNA formyltransferase n=1 Tax=Candidatus Roizmanbacteria bacterium RIFCSPLOWO2_02_FULL_36_11 TaxID=1802071 RepID=A0A1F7JHD5_9BACT|nr:MAG: hypothetical protein A3C23_04740 [Candidatus Roizmanbacteria bacterium RIFCSPHIGHO2_02_FULL_37_13b]OGK55015.1 MAG: hypothetical protein A3H78_00885 [Candidatus Roizmanbacteria bacterium RIFCSPLOWO2_02_FULL_36_11]